MQCACFVTKASVDAAPSDQQHISQDILTWPKKKLEYGMYCYLQKDNGRCSALKTAQKTMGK